MGVGHDRELPVTAGDLREPLAILHWNPTIRVTTQQTDGTGNELTVFIITYVQQMNIVTCFIP